MTPLEQETKIAMGFNEEAHTCQSCVFREERDYPSGVSYSICTFSRVLSFTVKEKSVCNKWKFLTPNRIG